MSKPQPLMVYRAAALGFFTACLLFWLVLCTLFIARRAKNVDRVPSPADNYNSRRQRVCYGQGHRRIACLYAYYEKNEAYKSNFEHFLKHGILPHVHYYIIINGDSTVRIPVLENLEILRRKNVGFDFGAYNDVLSYANMACFDYVFFINTSVCGPYLERVPSKDWTQPFINLFLEDASTALVGTSINVFKGGHPHLLPGDRKKRLHPHVQSMFFCLKHESLQFLLGKHTFHVEKSDTMRSIIGRIEIGMSYTILSNGWNINCVLPGYRGLDYRNIRSNPNPSGSDPYLRGSYFGKTIQREDVIFFKTNRNL